MFPGPGAVVYYNEAGEPLGWDTPSPEPEERNDEDDWNVWEDDDQREDEDDVEEEVEKTEVYPKVIWPGLGEYDPDDRSNEAPTEDDRFDERWARRFE